MKITASDRSALIRMAHALPRGSDERKAILSGIQKTAARDLPIKLKHPERLDAAAKRVIRDFENGDISYRNLHSYMEKHGYEPEALYAGEPK